MNKHVVFERNIFFILVFLIAAGTWGAMADSPDAPLMDSEQIKACQQGHMEVLSSYLGSGNTVVMACSYKAEWEPPASLTGKGILTTYAVIVRSEHQDFPVGTKVKWVNYIESPGSVAQEIIDRWKSPDGELVYIINPMKGSEGEGEDIAKVKNDIPELLDCIRFSIANKSFYNNLRAMLDIPVRREQ